MWVNLVDRRQRRVMRGHKTKKIALQWAKVDVKIIPLIKLMNADPEVHTTYSCQSDPDGTDRGYVTFYVFTASALSRIMEAFSSRAKISVEKYEGLVRHTMRFSILEVPTMCFFGKKHLLKE